MTDYDPCACCGAEMDEHWKYCDPCVEANCDMQTSRCGDEPEDQTDDTEPPIGGTDSTLSDFGGEPDR